MRAEVVAIGTELLLGQIVDTNSSWIGEQLALAGIDNHFQVKVGDNHDRMVRTLREALERADAVVVCGGLGPTQDDITREAIAEVMGVGLERDPVIVDRIVEMFRSRGREMPENNKRQADVPVGASTIAQQPGTAPGLVCPVGQDKVIYAVPGVPHEMKMMVSGTVIPDLRARSGDTAAILSRTLKTWGHSESGLAEMLADRIDALDEIGNPTLAFNASGIEGLKVRITAKAEDEAAAAAILMEEDGVLRGILGDLVFGVDDDTMETIVLEHCRRLGLTLAVAEGATGGLMAARLSSHESSDGVFLGGVIAADPATRQSVLAVGPDLTLEAISIAMAEGVRSLLGADVAIATSGVDSTVHLGLAVQEHSESSMVQLPGDRNRIQQFATISALDLTRKVLSKR